MGYASKCLTGAGLAAAAFASAAPASAEALFKIVTVKDEIVVGLNDAELRELGGDAGGIAKAIAAKGSLTLWQYSVTRKDGELVVAPRAKIGVLVLAAGRALQARLQDHRARLSAADPESMLGCHCPRKRAIQ